MAQKVPEVPRRCDRCEYQWWALEPPKRRGRQPRWYDDGATFTGNAAARAVRLSQQAASGNAAVARVAELFGMCARCGSHSVSTVKEKGFVPTGLEEARRAAQPLPPTSQHRRPPPARNLAPPPPPLTSGPPTHAGTDDSWAAGRRVRLKIIGSRGKTGTITRRTSFGYTVELDDGRTLKALSDQHIEAE